MNAAAGNGIYGLFALGDRLPDPKGLGGLGEVLQHRWQDGREQSAVVHVEDRASRSTLEMQEDQDGVGLFCGWIGDRPPADGGRVRNPCLSLVSRTFKRMREETPRLLPGEWTYLRWEGGRRRLTIIASENLRDPLYYCRGDDMIAVSPSLKRLSGLGWVSGTFNTEALMLSVGRTRLRRGFRHQSILDGVWQLEPGTCVELDASSHHVTELPPPQTGPVWTGSFEEAVEEVRSLLRHIMREHLQLSRRSAVMLSGGLDSTILAWLLAEQGGDARSHLALCSAAAPASGLRDESGIAGKVAEQLGLPFHRVVPDGAASPFRPSTASLAALERPSLSPRHYLYDALFGFAAGQDADCVLDGAYGEANLTAKLVLPWHAQPIRAGRRFLGRTLRSSDQPDRGDWFHVQLSDHLRNSLPGRFRDIHDHPLPPERAVSESTPLGYAPQLFKGGQVTTRSSLSRLRHATPFRDRRLMDLVATMPGRFLVNRDQNRLLGRAVLKGYISDDIRLRRTGMPFSPDYQARLIAHAGQARERVQAFRTGGVDQWLDLAWLDRSLLQLSRGDALSAPEMLKTQLTAMAAEFFLWWSESKHH